MPYYLWSKLVEGNQTPWDVGITRAQREERGFSYKNALLLEVDNEVVGCLIGYPILNKAIDEEYSEMPKMFVPLQRLEDQAVGSWYINVLAVYSEYRNRGIGNILISKAEDCMKENNLNRLSLIVPDSNPGAIRFYERNRFTLLDTKPMEKEEWDSSGENWNLFIKDIQ